MQTPASDAATAIKKETPEEVETGELQTQLDNTSSSHIEDDETQFDFSDLPADDDIDMIDEKAAPIEEEKAQPAVQIRALRTGGMQKAVSASFAPKFERVEAKSQQSNGGPPPTANGNNVNWKSVQSSMGVQSADGPGSSGMGYRSISPEDVLESDGSLRMFWFDALENNGVVYLFGKVWWRNGLLSVEQYPHPLHVAGAKQEGWQIHQLLHHSEEHRAQSIFFAKATDA